MSVTIDTRALAIQLPDELIEALAQRVAAILADQPADGTEPWLDVEGAATHLAVSVSHIYELCHKRRSNGFPVTKDGSRSYFRASELDAWRAAK